jgi:hypothetical protein
MTGYFAWHELMVPDPAAAAAFYGAVAGWGRRDASTEAQPYTLLTAEDRPAAGLLPLTPEDRAKGTLPGWIGHVLVADLEETLARAASLGATILVPPRAIEIGRFAVIVDPQGAVLALFAGTLPPPPMGSPGHVGWNELAATDWPAAFEFYATLFGWQRLEAVDIGPMGTYQTFGPSGGPAIGGMFNRPSAIPRPFWAFYIVAGDIDAAGERVRTAGGQVANGPMAVPGGAWILHGLDPQGAFFALLGTRATP